MSGPYILGTTIRAKSEFRDSDGNLIDPTHVYLRFKKPDDSLITKSYDLAEVTKSGVGAYEVFVSLDQPGQWSFRWEGTGNDGSVSETQLTVLASKVI